MFDYRVSKSLTWMICVSKFDFAEKLIFVDQQVTNFDFRIFDFAPQQRFERESVAARRGSFIGEIPVLARVASVLSARFSL